MEQFIWLTRVDFNVPTMESEYFRRPDPIRIVPMLVNLTAINYVHYRQDVELTMIGTGYGACFFVQETTEQIANAIRDTAMTPGLRSPIIHLNSAR